MSSPRQLYEYLRRIGIREDVARAFMSVDRAQFALSGESFEKIYSDNVVITYHDGKVYSTSSQPSLMAEYIQEAGIKRGSRVLEIGGGTGYNAAVMAEVVGKEGLVVSLEYDVGIYKRGKEILERQRYGNLVYLNRDGYDGAWEYAPFDAIIVTVAVDFVPLSWAKQLAEMGRIVVPLDLKSVAYHPTFVFVKKGKWIEGRERFVTSFIKAEGKLGSLDEMVEKEYNALECDWQGEIYMDRSGMWAVEVLTASIGKIRGFFVFADGKGKAVYKFEKWRLCGNVDRLERVIMELERERFPGIERAKVAFDLDRENFSVTREG